MPPEHLTWQVEAYLDRTLSAEERRWVEAHAQDCPACAHRLAEARQVEAELGPVLKTALGQPDPPPALRHRVGQALRREQVRTGRRPSLARTALNRWLGNAGALAAILLLVAGVFVVVRGRLPGSPSLSASATPPGSNRAGAGLVASATALPPATATMTSTPGPAPATASPPALAPEPTGPAVLPNPTLTARPATVTPTATAPLPLPSPSPAPATTAPAGVSPEGTIAFSFFNPAPQRQVYEIHLISADGANHRLFPLDGVSEPALAADGRQLAYRAWSEPTGPRSLLSGDLAGGQTGIVGGFWEDAQPDWSPGQAGEDRLIYASRRESDRRWRLYTSRGDGSAEMDLGLEGQAPTFAPDGRRFAYVGCDRTGNRCGLWQSDLGSPPSAQTAQASARVLQADALARAPDWSPGGGQIAYMANPGGNWDLYLVNSDGSGRRRLTDDPAVDGLPTWSPDGEWLAFLSNRGGNWGIWLLHLASGERRRVYAFDGGVFTPPPGEPYGQRNWWDEQLSWSR